MTVFSSTNVSNNTPGAAPASAANVTAHAHAQSASVTLALNDTIKMFTLPANAVVFGMTLKAQSQLDSNGAPALVFDVGDAGSANRYMAATALVGRGATVSTDTTMAATGRLFKTTADTVVIVKVNTAAATPVAGIVELEMAYFLEQPAGSQA